MRLMTHPSLELHGDGGLLHGVRHTLHPGEVVVVGRSRSCDISLRTAPGFVRHPRQHRVFLSRRFQRISRVHCQISYLTDGRLEVRDLSRNGTFVDGSRVSGAHLLPGVDAPVRVELCDAAYGVLTLSRCH